MKTRSLFILALTFLSVNIFAQMGQGPAPGRTSTTAPSRSTPSMGSSGGGGGSYSSPRGNSYSTPSGNTKTSTYSTGSSGSSGSSGESSRPAPASSGSSSMPTRSTGSGSSTTPSSGNSSGSYSTYPYYNNNPYYGTGGGSNSNTGIGSSSPAYGGSTVPNDNSWTRGTNDEQVRTNAKTEIRKTLATFDKSKQTYTVSGTVPSTITGLGGTRINVNPADLETVDGQPITGDINVDLKELDGAAKMGLAGAPTMSNGEMLVSGGSYFFGMTSGGKEVKLKEGKSMEVQLPLLPNTEPDMEVYIGQVDDAGNVNWLPTNQPLTVNGNETSGTRQPESTTNTGSSTNGNETPSGPGREENGMPVRGNTNNPNDNTPRGNTNTGNGAATPATGYYAPINITSMGYVNADKGFRNGVRMNVEVENADPAATQVYVVFKNVRSLVEGQPEQGFVSNNFLFNSIPRNENVKVVAISKANGKTYMGEVYTNTKTKRQFVTLKPVADEDAAKAFEYNEPAKN